MKRITIALSLLLLAVSAFGQDDSRSVNDRYFNAKIDEFVYRLHLTDAQKEQFVPVYKLYNEEMRAAVGKRELREKHPEASREAADLAKARIERQQTAQNIRMKYVDEFATILDADQLSRLYQVESQIQHKLMDRKNGHSKAYRGASRRGGRK